ncbi:hypothetical protein [Streptomyces sp. 142MFCol3.1]|nr:hypothetical protein [Streptomyces sp. 142MFCol3.1]
MGGTAAEMAADPTFREVVMPQVEVRIVVLVADDGGTGHLSSGSGVMS